jgi:hypothetical protein
MRHAAHELHLPDRETAWSADVELPEHRVLHRFFEQPERRFGCDQLQLQA